MSIDGDRPGSSSSPGRLRGAAARLRFPLVNLGLFVALSSVARGILAGLFGVPAASHVMDYARAFGIGLWEDIVAGMLLIAPFAVWCALRKRPWSEGSLARRTLAVTTAAVWTVLVFLFIAEGFFFEEFRSRFNTVAIDYLVYPYEVAGNIWESYPLPLVLAVTGLLGVGISRLTWKWGNPCAGGDTPALSRWGLAALWLVAAGCLAAPIRPATATISDERVINELAANGLVSGATAAATRHLDYGAFYRTVDRDAAYGEVRRHIAATFPQASLAETPDSIVHSVPGDPSRPRLNVVLLIEESLGSEFWGVLHKSSKPSLTPRMDEVARSGGLLFTNVYADGNRTVRGLEAVLCSIPPLPGDSVVVRDRSEKVETLARVLGRDGYSTSFIYGGRGLFDGMRGFMLRNGFDRFIERSDFDEVTFETVWGVCNEDLYDRVLAEARARHEEGNPFLITSLSVSNHKPFTYPEGRIPEDPGRHSRKNAVKYTDYALGRFFEMAREEAFWDDTIFVVVADHGARVYGRQTIPIRSYEIPFLVVGPSVVPEPRRVGQLGCQLDVAPTILGLIGRPYESLFFGRDLRKPAPGEELAILHHNRSIGLYAGERLVVLELNHGVEFFAGNPRKDELIRIERPDEQAIELLGRATAIFQVGDDLYSNRRFHF